MELLLDGRITTEAAFHDAVRAASGVGWYGGNLDALFDMLVGVVTASVAIRWTDAAASRAGIGLRFDRLLTVIFDAIAERGDGFITFDLRATP